MSLSARTRSRLSILFIDDDQDLLDCFAYYFAAAGVDVTKLADPREAVHTAATLRPDVIVLDVAMPQMNGFDVIDALMAQATTAPIPVVLFTGLIGPRGVKGAAKASACVQKPCAPRDLLGVVRMFGGRA